jgi:possible N-acetylmuramoyl-L-alanine amidase
VDGILGPETIAALQARLGVPVDGYVGMATVAALQTHLNEGTL